MKYAAHREYKASHADWLGDVPSHWAVKAIKWESPVLRGASPRPIDDPIYFDDDGEYAWVRISDVTEAGTYLENTEQKLSDVGARLSVKLKPGDLFLSIAGSVGKPCITRIKCCIHDGFVYFPRWKADPKFLYYLFASGEPYKGLGKMGTQLNLNTDTVGSIVIGLPDAEEQQTIARFLDAKTAQIDALVAQKRQLIDRLKEKRSALIARTVTRGLPPEAAKAAGLEPNPQMKDSGVEWLGEIPATWRLVPLGYLVRMRGGATPDKGKPEYWDGTIPWASPKDMKVARIFDVEDHISDEALHNSPLSLIPEAALLVVVRGMILAHSFPVALAMRELTINQDMKALICCRGIRPNYLYWTLRGFATSLISLADESAHGTKKIETALLARFPILVPGLSEQQAIADYLDCETTRLDALVTQIDEAASRLTEYRQVLITSAVTGKIDVREFRHARESGHPEEVAHVAA
jgi:type I restriction enzyme S subunit